MNKDVDSFNQALKVFVKNDVPALFWSGFSWGSWINLNLDSPEALVELPKVEFIMQRVLELDETYYYGGAHTFFGTAYGFRPPMLGGNLEKAREHFDKAGKIADGKFLLNYVYKARYYAVPIQDRNLFEAILQEVILAPPDILPEQRLVNEIAKVKAKEMLSQIDEFF